MADQTSNETIRQMMAGFSAMQYNLGLLPMQQSQAMAGAATPYQSPPPPPQVPHPSEAAMAAMQTQQNMMQQTMQAAQMTRYQPPPSAPTPAMSSMSAYGGFGGGGGFGGAPPYVGPLGGGGNSGFGGGGGYGGGGGGGGGGGFAGAAPFSPRMPSIFNPFAPTLPTAHFASPAMRNLQMMQHSQSQAMGMMAGIGEAGLGLGGSLAGGAIGGFFGGPLGAAAGSWLGGKVGGAVSSMMFNPVTQDFARGRQIQSMTSPFMVSGPYMNTRTGQGMDSSAARDVATGVRHLQRDHDFERTGFNTQDTMRIMQMSAGAGLLTGAQSPDQLVQKVKEISKSVKMLMRITGDPDVRDAIQSLGQMREMGFQGLAAQSGAVANRAAFARMAGQSQAQMTQTMMAGADMAGQYGLVGATGAMAGGFGAASANIAASSGALGDMQLARAGGRSGLGQINTQAQLSAMQNEYYLLAGSKIGKGGKLEMDMGAFRRAQTMSFDEVARNAADKLRELNAHGIFDWNTRKQEMKDQIAQQLKPGDMQMMMLQQARAFQAKVPGMTLGTAIQNTTGLGADQARSLEVQLTSRSYWQGLADQSRVERRELMEQERGAREAFRTPGLMTRMGRGVRGALGSVSDTISSPFRSASEYFERESETRDAAKSGERISRYDSSQIAMDDAERSLLRKSIHDGGLRRSYNRGGGSSIIDDDANPSAAGRVFGGVVGMIPGGFGRAWQRSTGRQVNRMSSFLGLSAESDENKLASVADFSRGRYTSLGESFGDPQESLKRVQDVMDAGRASGMATQSGEQLSTLYKNIGNAGGTSGKQYNAMDILARANQGVVNLAKDNKAGYIKSARAMAGSDLKEQYIKAATSGANPMTPAQAQASWNANKSQIMKQMSEAVALTNDPKLMETFKKAQEVEFRAGGVDLARSRDEAKSQISDELKKSGMGDLNDKTMSEVKSIVANHADEFGDDVIAMASAQRAAESGNAEEKKRGLEVQRELGEKYKNSPEKMGSLTQQATALSKSMSDDTADAFERTFRDTKDLKGVTEHIRMARTAAGHGMEQAARDEFTQKLASKVGRKDIASMGTDEAVASITEDELDKLDPDTKAAIKKFRATGDRSGVDEMIARSGPNATKVRHSDASSAALSDLDDRIASYEKQAAESTSDGTPESLQNKATDIFARSVASFAASVNILKGSSEEDRHNDLDPLNVSKSMDRS